MTHPKIGLVGVGRMGANMARRLVDCGFPVVALYDRVPEVAEALAAELNTVACTSLSQVSQRADAILIIVPDDKAMEDIFLSCNDNLLREAKHRLFLNFATITPSTHQRLKPIIEAAGADVLECPMASSIPQAREGTLYLMCAGERAVFDRARPVLQALSKSPRFVGESGKAAQMKALVNMVMNINTAALAEGLGLADALGLDLSLVREIFSQTGANSRVLETDADDMQYRDHTPFFSSEHAAKDSGIALALGREAGLPMVLAEATHRQYQAMVRLGLGELDKSGIAELTFLGRALASAPEAALHTPA